MHKPKTLFIKTFLAGTLAFFGNWCPAGIVDYSNPFTDYGTVSQPSCPIFGICGAVSATNSFVFLKNYYPKYYGGTTIDIGTKTNPTDASRDFADYGWTVNGITYTPYYSRNGNPQEDYLATIMDWLNGFAPRRTTFDGMWSGRNVDGRNSVPSWSFLVSEIKDHEAVQLFIKTGEGNNTQRHAINLTGINYDDTMSCAIDFNCKIDFQDPNKPNNEFSNVQLTLDNDGSLSFFDRDPLSNKIWSIYAAFSESPVPEPGTLWLVCIGIAAFGATTRRVGRGKGVSAARQGVRYLDLGSEQWQSEPALLYFNRAAARKR